MDPRFVTREFAATDADIVTDLLHRAYGEHLADGLNFTAATQRVSTTLSRARGGRCWVVTAEDVPVATLTMSIPPSHSLQQLTAVAAEPARAWLNQLAVDPAHRGEGIASALFRHAAAWAKDQGMTSVGIDTAAPAASLIAIYQRWGFEHRDVVHWDGKTYDSVVMVRPL